MVLYHGCRNLLQVLEEKLMPFSRRHDTFKLLFAFAEFSDKLTVGVGGYLVFPQQHT